MKEESVLTLRRILWGASLSFLVIGIITTGQIIGGIIAVMFLMFIPISEIIPYDDSAFRIPSLILSILLLGVLLFIAIDTVFTFENNRDSFCEEEYVYANERYFCNSQEFVCNVDGCFYVNETFRNDVYVNGVDT